MAEVSTIPAYILANENLLNWMLGHSLSESFITENRNILKEFVYVDFHRWNTTRPDHVFRHRWECFEHDYLNQKHPDKFGRTYPPIRGRKECSVVLACLECLADEYMEQRGERIHVQLERFGWWQNMLSRLSPLPVQAHALWRLHHPLGRDAQKEATKEPLMMLPFDDGVENYVTRHGLNDLHVHINLCASAEECWLNALADPEGEWKVQQHQFEKLSDVIELYREVHVELTPERLLERLHLAQRLRFLLRRYAREKKILIPHKRETREPDEDAPKRQEEEQSEEEQYYITVRERLGQLCHAPLDKWTDDDVHSLFGAPPYLHDESEKVADVVRDERQWMIGVISKLAEEGDPLIDRLFHIYLLLSNEFYTFCIQRDNFCGFKQFQKYSYIEKSIVGRPFYYESVFTSMHGNRRNSVVNYLEVRIAPKDDWEGCAERVNRILEGYLSYVAKKVRKGSRAFRGNNLSDTLNTLEELLKISENMRLVRPSIVFHLIKHPWNKEQAELGTCRHDVSRREYFKTLQAIKTLLEKYPPLHSWVRGIDAAAYEMDVPPDVFAPSYRKAKLDLGIRHVTFHTGEDFYHLASGIRTVCETVSMLDYQSGDRIGHATALGVDPSLWLKTMPEQIAPTRGDWLQDLVFIWNLVRRQHDMQELAQKLDFDIREQGYAVFQRPHLSPYILKRVFDLRKLTPQLLGNMFQAAKTRLIERYKGKGDIYPAHLFTDEEIVLEERNHPPYLSADEREEQMIHQAFCQETPEIIRLIINWQFGRKTWKRSDSRIEVPTEYFSVEELLRIQQLAMQMLTEKGIVVETLPTSNLRISQYKEMGQHHSLRWLGVGKHPGDSELLVVLGTDDPGVFNTCIKAEFYHLFSSLCKRGLSRQEALEKLIRVNECGNRYAFRALASNMPE